MSAPQSIALFPLNVVLFPEGPLPLRIFETRYVDMVRRCMREDQRFGVALIREGSEVGPADTFDIGTMAKIIDFHQLSDGFLGLSCVGEQRFRILSRSRQSDGLNLARVEGLARETKIALPARHARLAELLEDRSAATGRSLCRHRDALGRCSLGWISSRGNFAGRRRRKAILSSNSRTRSSGWMCSAHSLRARQTRIAAPRSWSVPAEPTAPG